MNINKLDSAIKKYHEKKEANPDYYARMINERNERILYYQSFTAEKIRSMTEDDLYEFIGKLWAMLIWGNKKYIVDKIIKDNGFENVKEQLADLAYGKKPLVDRWDSFLKNIKGMGPATISEILSYMFPYISFIFNRSTVLCLSYLEIPDMPKYNYQYTGEKYLEVCYTAKHIAKRMQKEGEAEPDLITVDYFLWDEILPLVEKKNKDKPLEPVVTKEIIKENDTQSLHEEVKEKLIAIGSFLGFESSSEVKITHGAIVDAVWEVKIGNMGKAIYVFEVQSKGSIDSLILNLKKAQSNPAVQAVIAVADETQLEKIRKESSGVITKESLRTWEIDDVLAVYDSLVRAHESINRLALVPESFSG